MYFIDCECRITAIMIPSPACLAQWASAARLARLSGEAARLEKYRSFEQLEFYLQKKQKIYRKPRKEKNIGRVGWVEKIKVFF